MKNFCGGVLSDILSRNQFNQKLKLMVEAPGYVIYSNTPLTRDPIGLEVWMRIGAEYSTLNEGWLRFEPVTSYVMVDAPGYVIYSNINIDIKLYIVLNFVKYILLYMYNLCLY